VRLVEVASVEVGGRRAVAAVAAEIDTIWARAIDEVTVKIAIHDGTRTESVRLQVFGDHEFVVGAVERVGRKNARIIRIKMHKRGFKKNKGDVVLAKDIKRIFAERVRGSLPQARPGLLRGCSGVTSAYAGWVGATTSSMKSGKR
jgi:uncharacterized Zn finger protein